MKNRGKINPKKIPKTKYSYTLSIKAGFQSLAEEYLETVLDIPFINCTKGLIT
ncbi:hypothetical protein LEP1GSC075_1254 [Leptospira interrogans str. Kito]|nr:hypothetical protein LEP1GSC069_1523 [Leptospira interrogans serovar Canicola str. Fiocruz LV133]EMK23209.1 hypothetical protein LEP1GSC075_1254 [Leptospira interrogans str. Kito]EMN77831.1 hypothetical protein LEP1GSC102_1354 [Leptospira interrogans str. UI 09600]